MQRETETAEIQDFTLESLAKWAISVVRTYPDEEAADLILDRARDLLIQSGLSIKEAAVLKSGALGLVKAVKMLDDDAALKYLLQLIPHFFIDAGISPEESSGLQ